MRLLRIVSSIVLVSLASWACETSQKQLLATGETQLALRSIQTRVFDTPDVVRTVRTVISTLQDLGFVIDQANVELGSVSATKLDTYALRMTVIVSPRGEKQVAVRANAQYELEAVEAPVPYQQFFAALEKGMFLAAQQVE